MKLSAGISSPFASRLLVSLLFFVLTLTLPLSAQGDPTQPEKKKSEDPGLTGVLDEEAFKKLHELKGEAAPAPKGEMLRIGNDRAYLSLPKGAKTPMPAVIVIHEWWGLNGHVKHWTDRLAADGYAALAVDLYGGVVATTPKQAMSTMKTVPRARALRTLKNAYDFLADDPRIKAERRACIGWCFGGKWSLELAMHAPKLDGAVIYYGRCTTKAEELAKISDRTHILGVFGNLDAGIPPAQVDRLEAALKTAKRHFKILRYDANHAFANPSSARYDKKAATAAWRRVRAFLATRLKAGVRRP